MASDRIHRRALLALPFASVAWASRWEEPQFPDWDEKFIDRIVSDSPWARPWKGTVVLPVPDRRMVASFGQIELPSGIPGIGSPRMPRGGGPSATSDPNPMVRLGVDLIIRWASALPVRRALALQEFGRDGLGHVRAAEMLAHGPRDMVIEIAGIPHAMVGDELERDLKKTRLSIPNRRPLTPLSVELPTMGVTVTARLRFARVENLLPEGTADLSVPGALRLDERFKLRSMVYAGRVEL